MFADTTGPKPPRALTTVLPGSQEERSHRGAIVYFASWCGHCARLLRRLSDADPRTLNTSTLMVDCTESSKGSRHPVPHYPAAYTPSGAIASDPAEVLFLK